MNLTHDEYRQVIEHGWRSVPRLAAEGGLAEALVATYLHGKAPQQKPAPETVTVDARVVALVEAAREWVKNNLLLGIENRRLVSAIRALDGVTLAAAKPEQAARPAFVPADAENFTLTRGPLVVALWSVGSTVFMRVVEQPEVARDFWDEKNGVCAVSRPEAKVDLLYLRGADRIMDDYICCVCPPTNDSPSAFISDAARRIEACGAARPWEVRK